MKIATAVELRVSGADETQYLSQTLYEGQTLRVGRAPQNGWAIPWDQLISREHADFSWDGERLRVTCLEKARNPLVFGDEPLRELSVEIGQDFRIGGSVFSVAEVDTSVSLPETVDQPFDTDDATDMLHSYSAEELNQVAFGNTARQMEILSNLPRMISSSESDEELALLLAGLLLEAIPGADGAAVAHFDESALPAPGEELRALPPPSMLQVETRAGFVGRFRPSRRMLMKALHQQESMIHIWSGSEGGEKYTLSEGLGWAFCAPIRGESCRGWCLYVSGQSSELGVGDEALKGDLRFTELVAQFIGSVRQVRLLQEHKTQMSAFFSPSVIESLTGHRAADALTPAERDISVLFCDVRGFSRKAEGMSHDLHGLLRSVGEALDVMSNGILERDGTIADFQGDAALGFWGWPVALEEGPVPACRAALDIYRGFRQGNKDRDSLLKGFSVGIGIVHGRAIAGQIGTTKQAKVGVFGPVVNQGARLEGLTKQFGAPICIDETTAEWVRRFMLPGQARLRCLARVRPQGMDLPLTVFQLMPAASEDSSVTDQMITDHDQGLKAVVEGHWQEARLLLGRLPGDDGPKNFLLRKMAELDNVPPADWDGAFSLTSK